MEFDLERGVGIMLEEKQRDGQHSSEDASNTCEGLLTTYHEYCAHTSIHGVQYLGDRERPLRERIFWLCAFLISIYACATLISSAYTKWTETVRTCIGLRTS